MGTRENAHSYEPENTTRPWQRRQVIQCCRDEASGLVCHYITARQSASTWFGEHSPRQCLMWSLDFFWYDNARYFLCKGKEKATTEYALSALAYDIRRAINIFGGVQKLIERYRRKAVPKIRKIAEF